MKSSSEKNHLIPENTKRDLPSPEELQLGEYFLHIYIMETTGLVSSSDAGIDALLKISAFGDSKYTQVKKDIGTGIKSFWGEHFFFTKIFENREEIENANFEITFYDHNSILKNTKIGSTSGAVSQVYFEKDHCLHNKWDILTNPEFNYRKPMGFVKYSINFVRAGDKRTNLELQNFGDRDNKFDILTIPPNIKLNQKQIIIRVFRGERLVKMDTFGEGADPFLKFDLGGLVIKTDYQKSTLNPVFNRVLYIPTIYPTMVTSLKMTFKDYDTFGKNEIIGSSYYKLEDIEKGYYKFPKWTYFYGAYEKSIDEEIKNLMNNNSDLASTFKGALLLSISMEEREEFAFTNIEMTKEDNQKGLELEKIKFKAIFDIEFVQNFNGEVKDYHIEINWGGRTWKSKKVNYNKGVLLFFERITLEEIFEIQTKNSEEKDIESGKNNDDFIYDQLPDLILSIVNEEKHFSYFKFRPENFLSKDLNGENSLSVFLHPDNSVSNIKESQSGNIYLKLGVGRAADFNNWPNFQTSYKLEKIHIMIDLYQAKDLIPSDDDGAADPLIQFYHLGALISTSTFPRTLNPSWNQRLTFQSFSINGKIPPLILNVWDKDVSFIGNNEFDFMGTSIIELENNKIIRNANQILTFLSPSWYDVRIKKKDFKGQVLCNFKIIPSDLFYISNQYLNQKTPLQISKSKHMVKISILGLRNLQSSGLLPIKNTEIKISTTSLKSVENMQEGTAFTDLVAHSTGGGNNPNIGTVLCLNVDLPNMLNLMPSLSSQVLDRGLSYCGIQKIIGTFQITLSKYAYITLLKLKKNLGDLEKYLTSKTGEVQNLEKNLNAIKGILNMIEVTINSTVDNEIVNNSVIWQKVENKRVFQTRALDFFYKEKEEKNKRIILNSYLDTPLQSIEEYEPGFVRETKRTYVMNDFANNQEGMFSGLAKKFDDLTEVRKTIFEKFRNKMIVILPEYDKDEEEINIPDPNVFFEIGFKSKSKNTKHYRKHLEVELEKTEYLGKEMFSTIDIYRGKYFVDKKSFFEKLFSFDLTVEESFRKTGSFRGMIDVVNRTILDELINLDLTIEEKNKFDLPISIENWKYNQMDEQILKNEKVIIRVYVIDALFYSSEDMGSENDSYMVLELGDQKYKDKNVVEDRNHPLYFSKFEFEHSFPGASDLVIKFYDEDNILKKDDLIGESVIDLESRYFDQIWRKLPDKPIEKRQIYNPLVKTPKGECRLWVDMYPKSNMKDAKNWDIAPRPLTNLELRVVVWDVHDVPSSDFEDVSDIYVAASLPSFNLEAKTDTHYRAQNHFGSFNWRLIFKLKIHQYLKDEDFRIDFKVYDKDFLKSNDYIADTTLNISSVVNTVLQEESRRAFLAPDLDGDKYSKTFFVDALVKKKPNKENDEDKFVKIVLSIDCLTQQESELSPAGIGRSNPNQDPYLPSPTSRFVFSLNPFKMLSQLCGPQFKRQLCFYTCIILFLVFVLVFLPTLVAAIVAKAI